MKSKFHISKLLGLSMLLVGMLTFSSCHQGPLCPAYNSVHTDKNYGYNPNNKARSEEDNKADIEARKKAELSPKRSKRGKTSLFPKGMRVR